MTYKEIINILHKIIESIKYTEEISKLPNCNDCAKSKKCKYAPKLGEMVRINCHLHESKEKVKDETE